MDKIIREGALRLLITESSCDVILSCKNHRLMAHKLILSIASPIFRILLLQNSDATSVIIMPDITSTTMSLILDYIYTGTVLVQHNLLDEFLATVKFLQIQIDYAAVDNIFESISKKKFLFNQRRGDDDCGALNFCKKSTTSTTSSSGSINRTEFPRPIVELIQKAFENGIERLPTRRKIPDLLPIGYNHQQPEYMNRKNRKICTKVVVPSPWCPRSERILFGDPRESLEIEMQSNNKIPFLPLKEDSNNNFQISRHNQEKLRCHNNNSKKLDKIIRNLYLNNPEKKNVPLSNNEKRVKQEQEKEEENDEDKKGNDNEEMSSSNINNNDLCSLYQSDKISNQSLDFDVKSSSSCSQNNAVGSRLNKLNSIPSAVQIPTRHEMEMNKKFYTEKPIKSFKKKSSSSSSSSTATCTNLPQQINNNNCQKFDSDENDDDDDDDAPLSSYSNNENENSLESLVDSCRSQQIGVKNRLIDEQKKGNDEKSLKQMTIMKKKSYECTDCGKRFSQMRNYKYHRSVHEGTKEFSAKCPECDKTFNDKGYLSSHMKIHRDKKEYACPNCPKRFNQRVAYNMHLRIHTGLKPHECSTCGKSFSRKMLLKQHQRVHTGERPYSCPECGKTFADRSNMSLHARLHTGVKPYTCTLCPKSFTKKHHLKTHMNFHTGLKPYTCENCGLSFSQSSNMRTHYKKCILKECSNAKKGIQNEAINSTDNSS